MPTDSPNAHAAIDETLADSFPASDPPSFTPVTGATNSDQPRDDADHRGFPRRAALVAAGAGGHAGTISPLAFVVETRSWFDGPIALSGAIANGRAIRAARILGADFAYIGSAFIATTEANAVEAYKQMITSSSAEDIVYSNLFTGVHGNYLKPSIVKAGLNPDELPTSDPSKMSFGTDASGERAKPKAWKDIWGAGQGVGLMDDLPSVGALVERLKREYDDAKARLGIPR